jgi:hypothetical protein
MKVLSVYHLILMLSTLLVGVFPSGTSSLTAAGAWNTKCHKFTMRRIMAEQDRTKANMLASNRKDQSIAVVQY